MPTAWLGLGTNLGDRRANLRLALGMTGRLGDVAALSWVYESEPVGFADQPVFWNMAARLSTDVPPQPLLAALKRVERCVGREPTFRNGPRLMDIDLLLYDDRIIQDGLTVPHPRMLERAFVLRPLVELQPDLMHPVTGERLADVLSAGRFEALQPIFPGTALFQLDTG
ncbi:MAG: 2-amino-4-hydroxy-6-hydroxymethyldihydropteridine diphosphokinase [Gemmatimonadota bacterium]